MLKGCADKMMRGHQVAVKDRLSIRPGRPGPVLQSGGPAVSQSPDPKVCPVCGYERELEHSEYGKICRQCRTRMVKSLRRRPSW